jgi:hypothetical protein
MSVYDVVPPQTLQIVVEFPSIGIGSDLVLDPQMITPSSDKHERVQKSAPFFICRSFRNDTTESDAGIIDRRRTSFLDRPNA